jgi:hypothetical protein
MKYKSEINKQESVIRKKFSAVKKRFIYILKEIQQTPFALLLSIFALIPVGFSVIFYKFFISSDFVFSTFEWLFFSIAYEKILVGCFDYSKFLYFKKISIRKNNILKNKKEKNIERFEKFMGLLVSIVLVSVYLSLILFKKIIESPEGKCLENPQLGLLMTEVIIILFIALICFGIVKSMEKTISNIK